jgi:hypothetical protein
MRRDGARWCSLAAFGVVLATLGCGEGRRSTPGASPTESPDPRGRDEELLVLDEFGRPFVNTPVLVDGTLTVTGDDGFAALPELGPSYDVSFVTDDHAFVFEGLRSRAPVLELPSLGPDELFGTTLQIQKPADLGDDTAIRFMAGVKDTELTPHLTYSTNDSDVELEVVWPGMRSETLSAEAFLVQINPLTEEPLVYLGYAAEDWPAVAPSVTWAPGFTAPPFDTAPVHVELTLPDGASVQYYEAEASDGSDRRGPLGYSLGNPGSTSAANATADVLVPDLAATTYTVFAHTSAAEGGFVAQSPDGVHAGDSIRLVARAGPVALTPASGAVVDSNTDFTWTPVESAVHYLFIFPVDDGSSFDITLATTEAQAHLPDLSALGLPFPAGRSIRWLANAVTGVATLDAYAAGAPSRGYGYSGYRDASVAAAP